MNTTDPEVRRLRWLETCAGFYLAFAVGRLIYESVETRGVYGWLADEQMHHLGHFDLKLTLIGAAAVYLLPVSFVFNYTRRIRAALVEDGLIAPKVNDALREAVKTARLFMLLGLGCALAGGITYYVMLRQNEANALLRVERYPVETLEGLSAAEVDKLKFAEIGAICQTQAGYLWSETNRESASPDTRHRCVPLTRTDWRPGQPVRYFLETTVDVYYPPYDNGQPVVPHDYNGQPFAGSFEGELKRDALPAFVYNDMRRKGITIASPYYVLEHETLSGKPKITSWQEMLVAPVLGGFVGMVFFLPGVIMYVCRRGYAARIAARRGWAPIP